jgi:uncharacterized protein (TIGR02231 family)
MKKWFISILALCFVASPAMAAQSLTSRIKEVTLFTGQALVTREAHTTVQKGLNELHLEIETFHIDEDSVSAKISGAGEILSVQFKTVPIKESPQDKIRVLQQKIRDVKQSKRVLTDKKKVLAKQETFLDSLVEFSKSQLPEDIKTTFPKTEELQKTLLFLSSGYQKINESDQALDTSIEEADEELNVLQEELGNLRRPGKQARQVIEIVFNATKNQTIGIESQYITRNATWEALYRASVPFTLGNVNLTMFSKIGQTTGEDWKNVALAISNVIPLRGVHLPSLASWTLDIPRPQARVVRKASRLALDRAVPSAEVLQEEAGLEEPAEEAAYASAYKKVLPLSFEYTIPQSIDIESRKKETIIPLFTKKLEGNFYYSTIPKQSPLTFLICETRADKELLRGSLNVYFGGRYIGKTYLDEKKAGESFQMNLGADREIMVGREKIRDQIKETFFGQIERNTIVRELAYTIKAENIKNRPIVLKIVDSVPVSRTDKIEIKDIKISPEPAEKNYRDQEGVLLWDLKLKPGETQEIRIEFAVSYPKDLPPVGL